MTGIYVRSTTASMILRIAYGYVVQETDDPFVKTSDEAMSQVSEAATPGNFLVNIIPARELLFCSFVASELRFA